MDWERVRSEYAAQIDAVERVMRRRFCRSKAFEVAEEGMHVARCLLWFGSVRNAKFGTRRTPWSVYPALVVQELNRGLLVLLVLAMSGCASMPKLTEAVGIKAEGAILDAKLQSQAEQVVRDIGWLQDSKIRQVTNDLYPLILLLLGLALILVAGALVLVWMWIRRNSYLQQKPKWELHRRVMGS